MFCLMYENLYKIILVKHQIELIKKFVSKPWVHESILDTSKGSFAFLWTILRFLWFEFWFFELLSQEKALSNRGMSSFKKVQLYRKEGQNADRSTWDRGSRHLGSRIAGSRIAGSRIALGSRIATFGIADRGIADRGSWIAVRGSRIADRKKANFTNRV